MRLIRRALLPDHRADRLGMVVDEHSVMEDREDRRCKEITRIAEARSTIEDIDRLPLPRRPAGIHHWWVLAVERTHHAVGIRDIHVRIEDLDLVDTH